MMTEGAIPFDAPDATSFLVKHLKEKPLSTRARSSRRSPRSSARSILQLLEKDPKARPVDAHRIESDLTKLARAHNVPIPIEPESDPASARPPAKTLPHVTADQWVRRTVVFQQMLEHAFAQSPPADLKKLLGDRPRTWCGR